MKIKAIPIKSRNLCKKCRHNSGCAGKECADCNINSFKQGDLCYCVTIQDGERCEHFERHEGENHIELKPCPFCGETP